MVTNENKVVRLCKRIVQICTVYFEVGRPTRYGIPLLCGSFIIEIVL